MRPVIRQVARQMTGVSAVFLIGAASAQALTVKDAVLASGVITVTGAQAARSAVISWEGTPVATAGKGGGFTFATTVVPRDCVGSVSDGVSTVDVPIAGCVHMRAFLPPSGQTISYAPGDDAAVLAQGTPSYTDNGDGTVTDNRSGLMWEKKTDATVNQVYIWDAARDYVAALNTMNNGQGYAGYNDWRLPNIRELLSLVSYAYYNPTIDPIFGPTVGILNFVDAWSSTSWSDGPTQAAWAVDFRYGGSLAFGKGSPLRVRAVRGGL